MTEYRIEIISPGGLPSGITGITEDEYLSGKLSVLRNRNLANVFYRLGFVEIFGTGITRIKQLYEGVILSRLVDTFISKISLTMLPVPKPHNTACVLSWEEARRWQSRSSGYSSS